MTLFSFCDMVSNIETCNELVIINASKHDFNYIQLNFRIADNVVLVMSMIVYGAAGVCSV